MPHVLSVGCGLECLLHPNRLQQFVAAVIRTTSNHLFWEPYLDYGWISADHLKPGYTFNDLVWSGMSPEEAAASTFTGKMAARFGFTDVSITSLSGEPGAYTDVQALFTRPAG